MNRTQKGAWCGVFISAFILLVPVIRMNIGGAIPALRTNIDSTIPVARPSIGDIIKNDPLLAHLFFIIIPAVLLLLAIFFINRKRKNAEAEIDERDRFIIRRALIAAFVSICVIPIVAYYAVAIFALEPEAVILVRGFPIIIYFFYIIFILIFSVAILVQYGREGKDGKK
jgi:ABC-type xylose transport system permease subunit